MNEYVERAKVENWLLTECASLDTQVDRECVVERLREDVPSADVRPIVLCRDCKHGQGEKMDFWNEYDGIECIGGVVHRKDWFCADGEKKEET